MIRNIEVQDKYLGLKGWLAVGQESEVSETGHYLSVNIELEPIVLTRNAEGEIKALSRVCRHRGFDMLEGENAEDGDLRGKCGTIKRLRCPYHAWTYDLNGQLIAAPMANDITDFDKTEISLPSFAVELVEGVIFVNLEANPTPLLPLLEAQEASVSSFLANEIARA